MPQFEQVVVTPLLWLVQQPGISSETVCDILVSALRPADALWILFYVSDVQFIECFTGAIFTDIDMETSCSAWELSCVLRVETDYVEEVAAI